MRQHERRGYLRGRGWTEEQIDAYLTSTGTGWTPLFWDPRVSATPLLRRGMRMMPGHTIRP